MKTPNELRTHLADKAASDADFRARLLDDPEGAIGDELGVTLPAGFKVEVHEEGADVAHIVLPSSGHLNDADLQAVAAGAAGDSLGGGTPYTPPPGSDPNQFPSRNNY